MKKQTVWLLIVLVGVFFVFLVIVKGNSSPFPKLLAQVGVAVGVVPNPYNTLDAQLNQKQDQLNQQISDLVAREAAFASSAAATNSVSPMVWYLVVAIALVALLVLLNFYFDWRRSRHAQEVVPAAPNDPENPKE
jgi:predicted PurR-regulated permease PerM